MMFTKIVSDVEGDEYMLDMKKFTYFLVVVKKCKETVARGSCTVKRFVNMGKIITKFEFCSIPFR